MNDVDAFRNAKPGDVVIYHWPRRDLPENRQVLSHRKDDNSGWWLVDGSGLDDHAFDEGPWELVPVNVDG